ncbi:transport protein [Companilactobacillus mindensis DSM 14500]|uniref:Transport protein n=1 Tax=Companilactobacillus mindensis DSM 14500 TaxID=1423770 RepID=A0A0R1QJ22_9LACO|nr:hypothetical protein [Companilactobacillus mindensis]KRL44545.1 transport protein [Companilactobacillus mindensis DSM 14500]GEO79629.1 hypothetical protein LMI01_19600 [Companilactobacillus mindensis]
MLKNEIAMFKLQLRIALKENLIYFYTLIIPILMVFINKNNDFQDNESLYLYWSYIVVTTVLNGFLLRIIKLRENGLLKILTYMTGSKFSVLLAIFLVQLLSIQLQILFFNLIVALFITKVSLITWCYGFLTSFLAIFLCTAMLSGLLILRVKFFSFMIVINLFLWTGLVLLGLRPKGILHYFLTVFNPFQLILGLYSLPYATLWFVVLEASCTLLYFVMGYFIFEHFSIQKHLERVRSK